MLIADTSSQNYFCFDVQFMLTQRLCLKCMVWVI